MRGTGGLKMSDMVIKCKFCVIPHADLLFAEFGVDENDNPVNFHVDIDGQNIRYFDDFCSSIVSRQINYCPMCGRRLNDDQ
jgi:hypothetical protein